MSAAFDRPSRAAILAALTGLGACSVSQVQVYPSALSKQSAIHTDQNESWMRPEARREDLIYLSNVNGTVTVFSYPAGKLVGTLRGFTYPRGECADNAGDVFITEPQLGEIVEYAHAGEKPIETLRDEYGSPGACSVDSTTGDVAALDGGISIFRQAKDKPVHYKTHRSLELVDCGYDNKGNLFVDGVNLDGASLLDELPKGARTLKNIQLKVGQFFGDVQWDGSYLAVGNGQAPPDTGIYDFKISKWRGTKVRSVTLSRDNTGVFWIQGDLVAALPSTYSPKKGIIRVWKYPAGGEPTKTIHQHTSPVSVTISVASRRP